MKNLILFDIDGTLLLCGPQIRPLFVGALVQVFGGDVNNIRRPDGYNFSGKTDPRIVLDLMKMTGLGEEEILTQLPEMQRVYFARLEAGLDPSLMRVLPGVVPLLERLQARDDVLIGLLTGNWCRGAEIKLSSVDLGRFFTFGAYGDDGVNRRDLVPVGMARAAEVAGHPFDPGDVTIVGDAVLDVDCARAAGARSLAVGTGFTSLDDLREAGADLVFADLEEASAELELLSRSRTERV